VLAVGGSLPVFASGTEWARIWRHVNRSLAGSRRGWDFYFWFPYRLEGQEFVLDSNFTVVAPQQQQQQLVVFNNSFWMEGQPNGKLSTCLDCNDQAGQIQPEMCQNWGDTCIQLKGLNDCLLV
jgi:hypothetical protein